MASYLDIVEQTLTALKDAEGKDLECPSSVSHNHSLVMDHQSALENDNGKPIDRNTNLTNLSKEVMPTNSCAPRSPVSHATKEKKLTKKIPIEPLLRDACRGLAITPPEIYLALSDDDLMDLAQGRIGLPDVHAFAKALAEHRDRENGVIPERWDKLAQCEGCGPVWLWVRGTFAGCPWCFNRAKGLAVPRPARN